MRKNIIILISIFVIILVLFVVRNKSQAPITISPIPSPTPTPVVESKNIIAPFTNWKDRATKKHYGTFVEPGNSPVTPEVFRGYHTGTDFEILPGEAEQDVAVTAICSGKILRKETARGYGGMVVQSCNYNNEPVVVVYGHVRLASMAAKIGETINQGDKFVVLGTGFSAETSNERKHLHLSIHKGASVVTNGYVSTTAQLSAWWDPESLF